MIVPLFIAASPTEPSVSLEAVPVNVITPVFTTFEASEIIDLTDLPEIVISPVFVTVPLPVPKAKIPVELSEFVTFIVPLFFKFFPEAAVYIAIFFSPPVISNSPLVDPSNSTIPSLTYTRLLFLLFFDVNLKFFILNVFELGSLKYAAVAFSLPSISTFIIDSLVVPGNVTIALVALLVCDVLPPSRSINPKKANPIPLFPVILIGLVNNNSPLV